MAVSDLILRQAFIEYDRRDTVSYYSIIIPTKMGTISCLQKPIKQ